MGSSQKMKNVQDEMDTEGLRGHIGFGVVVYSSFRHVGLKSCGVLEFRTYIWERISVDLSKAAGTNMCRVSQLGGVSGS